MHVSFHDCSKTLGRVVAVCLAFIFAPAAPVDAADYLPGSVLENSSEVRQANSGDFTVRAHYGYSSQGDYFEPGFNLVRQDFGVGGGFSPYGPIWIYLDSETIANSSNRTSPRRSDTRRIQLGAGAGYEFSPVTVGLYGGFDRLEEPGGTPDTFKYEGATSWRVGGAMTWNPDEEKHWRLSLALGYLFDNSDRGLDAGQSSLVAPSELNVMQIRGDYRLLAGASAVADYDPLAGFIELYTEQAASYDLYSEYEAEYESVRFVENPIYLTVGGLFRINDFLRLRLGAEIGLSDRLERSDGEKVAVVPLTRFFGGLVVDYRSGEE